MSCSRRVFTTSSSTTRKVITQSSNGAQHIETTTTYHSGGGQPTQITYQQGSSSSTGWQPIIPGTTFSETVHYKTPVEKNVPSSPSPPVHQSKASSAPSGGSGDFSDQVLQHHNILRQKHNVPALVLDSKVAAVAQNWANRLAQENRLYHNPQRSGYGENVFQGVESNTTASSVCQAFYSEIKDYRFGVGPRGGAVTGHFTQLVWKSSQKLGVGRAKSRSGNVFVVCNYDPPGNFNNEYNKNVPPPS